MPNGNSLFDLKGEENMDEQFNKPGEIDTSYERSILEYRPHFEYDPDREITVTYQPEIQVEDEEKLPSTNEQGDEDIYIPETRPGEIYDEIVNVIESIDEVIEEITEVIKDIKVPIPSDLYDKIIDSVGSVDEKLEDGVITFPVYEETFEDPDDPTNSLIQDIVTDYAEGTEGSLELEVYEDLRESKSTMEETYYAFKELILNQFVEEESIPGYPSRNSDFVKELDKKVTENIEKGRVLRKAHEEAETNYYDQLRTSYGESSFFEAQEEFTATKRPVDLIMRENKHLTESMDLITRMINGSDACVTQIKTGLVWPSNIEGQEVMTLIENQKEDETETEELKNLLTLSLKLQMNQQIEDKKPLRDILKNINNLSRKKRAHNELLTAYQLRDKMYLTMYDSLEYLQSPSKDLGVEAFLNQVAGGMNFVEKEYEGFLNEVYQIYTMDSEVRLEKIEKVLEKEDARVGYRLLTEN